MFFPRLGSGRMPPFWGSDPLSAWRMNREYLILDGGLATELEARGANLDHPLWSAKLLLDDPDLIRAVHLDYFRAGADLATTATYQATIPGFERCGFGAQHAERRIRRAVELAQEARDAFCSEGPNGAPVPIIAGSAGCYGASLADGSEYRGEYSIGVSELIAFHRPRLDILLDAGVDLIAFETIPCIDEAEAIAALLREYSGVSAWVSFSCRDGERIWEGQRVDVCAALLHGLPNVIAVGVNCTAPEFVTPLLRRLAPVVDAPLIAYPNSGETFDAERRAWRESGESCRWTDAATEWFDLGARLIGGCCRTTPDNIRQLRNILESASA